MDLRRIEEAAMNAWPALQQLLYDGWILRFAQGYTKRANSVNPLFESTLDLAEKVAVCENLYAERDLRPIFRLPAFCAPPELDHLLEARGYARIDTTLVQILDLARATIPPPALSLEHQPLDAWLDTYYRVSSTAQEKRPRHRQILQAILPQRCLVALIDGGEPVACGVGVLERGYLGFFNIVTAPRFRNRGHATQLMAGILRWGQMCGGSLAYLQVMEENGAARRLYAKAGFREVYRYWYRVRE